MSRRKGIIMFWNLCFVIVCCLGCGAEEIPKPIAGKYISTDGNSYIVLGEYSQGKSDKFDEIMGYCDAQFTNVDLSSFAEFCEFNGAGNYIMVNKLTGLTTEETAEIRKKFRNNIDLNAQFVENKAEFGYFYSESEKKYGLCCEIEGSGFDGAYECYVAMEYNLKDRTIVCDDIKYILEE